MELSRYCDHPGDGPALHRWRPPGALRVSRSGKRPSPRARGGQ